MLIVYGVQTRWSVHESSHLSSSQCTVRLCSYPNGNHSSSTIQRHSSAPIILWWRICGVDTRTNIWWRGVSPTFFVWLNSRCSTWRAFAGSGAESKVIPQSCSSTLWILCRWIFCRRWCWSRIHWPFWWWRLGQTSDPHPPTCRPWCMYESAW